MRCGNGLRSCFYNRWLHSEFCSKLLSKIKQLLKVFASTIIVGISCIAESRHIGLGAAVRCVLHQGPLRAGSDGGQFRTFVKNAALRTVRHQGRERDIRCKCAANRRNKQKRTFIATILSQNWGLGELV